MDTILPPSSTQLCPHLCLQSFSITLSTPSFAQLHSSSSCAFKQEESLLFHFRLSLLYFNWHPLAYKKGDVLCIFNPKICVPPRPMVPYTLPVCMIWPCCPPESAWSLACINMEESSTTICDHDTTIATPKLPSHLMPVRTLKYVQRQDNVHLIFIHVYLFMSLA